MPLQESLPEDIQITRFCHQVLQLEQSLAYPDDKVLRRNESQEILYHRLFSEDLPHPLPIRYRLRVLKELVGKIEQCISDWDNHVRLHNTLYFERAKFCHLTLVLSGCF